MGPSKLIAHGGATRAKRLSVDEKDRLAVKAATVTVGEPFPNRMVAL